MDILIVVHIKSSYDSWKAVFDLDPGGRVEFSDESRTRLVGWMTRPPWCNYSMWTWKAWPMR